MSFIGNTPTQQSFTAAVDVFSGNGSTTAFTLSRPVATVAQVEAFIENVPQSPVDAFTVNGSTITFTSAPPSGSSNIYVRYTSSITQVIAPSDGSVNTNQLVNGAVTNEKMAAGVASQSGEVSFFAMSSAPAGWLKANGATISRSTYAALFAAIGTTFGAGDGSTTFTLPDLRGEFIRGFSDGRSVDSGRTFGSFQKGSLVGIDGPGGANCSTSYANTGAYEDLGMESTNSTEYPNAQEVYSATATGPSARFGVDAGTAVVRPRNLAMLACIKF